MNSFVIRISRGATMCTIVQGNCRKVTKKLQRNSSISQKNSRPLTEMTKTLYGKLKP